MLNPNSIKNVSHLKRTKDFHSNRTEHLAFFFIVTFNVFIFILVQPQSLLASQWTCVPQGKACTFGSDCCSENCVNDPKLGSVCKLKGASWSCVPEGIKCTFDSDCCTKKCINDPHLGSVCKPQNASWTCVPRGHGCTFDSECCDHQCVSDPKLRNVCK